MSRSCCGSRERAGLTLLELVVVMAILVALGGLLVPLLGNYLHRANVASCTTNIPELDKWMQTYLHLHAEYPDRFDNLAIGSDLASYVMAGDFSSGTSSGGPSITARPLEDVSGRSDAESLTNSGITTLCNMVENAGGDWNPTIWPYSPNSSLAAGTTSVVTGMSVATVTETGARLCGLPWNSSGSNQYKYVVFGMNTPCTLFRIIVEEAPTHFADTPTEDPATWYMCFGAIFMVRDGNGNVLENAKYMGAVAFHGFGLATGGAHTKEWWERLNQERPNK